VIAWLDGGKDLTRCWPGPWMTKLEKSTEYQPNFELVPVIRNEPRTAINSSRSATKTRQLQGRAAAFHQSRALLNLDYGQHFEDLEVYKDPFFSILPIFKYKALAESQFLNLVESVLMDDLESTRLAKPRYEYLPGLQTSHDNFVFHRELLESHARNIRENLWSIKSRGGPDWPKSTNEKVTIHPD
jgi:hypothetical protein